MISGISGLYVRIIGSRDKWITIRPRKLVRHLKCVSWFGDNTVRVVEYYIMEAEEDEVLGLIQFSAPKEYIRLIEKKAAQKYDDF